MILVTRREYFKCGVPNLSTSIFDTTIFEDSNSFSPVSNTFSSESEISFSFPNAIYSPTKLTQPTPTRIAQRRKDIPLRIVMLNCQLVKASGKPDQLKNIVSSLQADVINTLVRLTDLRTRITLNTYNSYSHFWLASQHTKVHTCGLEVTSNGKMKVYPICIKWYSCKPVALDRKRLFS